MNDGHKKPKVDYIKLTLQQAELVEKLAREAKANKGDSDLKRLEIEIEALAFYRNAAKGDPKARAQKALKAARASVLGHAVVQPFDAA
jgi:hypothetical protein